jgi:hypothetical protein
MTTRAATSCNLMLPTEAARQLFKARASRRSLESMARQASRPLKSADHVHETIKAGPQVVKAKAGPGPRISAKQEEQRGMIRRVRRETTQVVAGELLAPVRGGKHPVEALQCGVITAIGLGEQPVREVHLI